jgi:hypothetical protein
MRAAASLLAAGALLAGCGGGDESEAEQQRERTESTSGLPSCDATATTDPVPAGFPDAFPLPAGTVITSVGRGGGATFVRGIVPLSLKQSADFFRRRVPKAGFEPGAADAEPWEAESEFSGHGVEGKWKVNELPACLQKAALLVAVSQAS